MPYHVQYKNALNIAYCLSLGFLWYYWGLVQISEVLTYVRQSVLTLYLRCTYVQSHVNIANYHVYNPSSLGVYICNSHQTYCLFVCTNIQWQAGRAWYTNLWRTHCVIWHTAISYNTDQSSMFKIKSYII